MSELDAIREILPDAPALAAALESLARRRPSGLASYITSVEQEVSIENTKARTHCYLIQFDGNGFSRLRDFIIRICEHVTDYAIPRSEILEAHRKYAETGSTHKWNRVGREAKNLFVDLATTGEGGELIAFVFAEYIFGLPQIICKMSLKTSESMHYHGADGIHAGVDPDTGILSLYWCESKMHETPNGAVTEALKSLAPFLLGGTDGKPRRDLKLLRSYIDLNNETLENAVKTYLDPDNQNFNKLKYCGLAFVGFNSENYPADTTKSIAAEVTTAVKTAFDKLKPHIGARVAAENIATFDIHVICMPFNSVAKFREVFLSELGINV